MREPHRFRIKGTHRSCFRSGHWANVIGAVLMGDRPCLEVQYADGMVDQIPIAFLDDVYETEICPVFGKVHGPSTT